MRGRYNTIQTRVLKKIVKICRKVLETNRRAVTETQSKTSRFCYSKKSSKIITSECGKLAQKEYKPWHDWVGKVIHWEMCKKFKFDHANKWYMHNPAPVLENDTHKFLWEFNIQTDHLNLDRKSDLIIINKKRKSAKFSTLLSWLTTE